MPGQLRGLQFPCPFWPSALEKLEGYFYLAPRVDFIGHYEKQEVQATSPSRGVGGVVDVAGDRGRERGLCFTWGAREQPALCPEQSGQVQVAKRNLRLRAEDPGSGRRPQSRPVGTPGCHSAVPGLTVPSPPGLSSWAWLGCVSPTPPLSVWLQTPSVVGCSVDVAGPQAWPEAPCSVPPAAEWA